MYTCTSILAHLWFRKWLVPYLVPSHYMNQCWCIQPMVNFSEIWIKIGQFSYKKINSKMAAAKWRPFCLHLNVLTHDGLVINECQWIGLSMAQVMACHCLTPSHCLNTLRPRQNGCHFPDDTFKLIFFNENVRISIEVSLMFVTKCSIKNIPALVEKTAWRRPGDKPLSEPMMVRLLTHICVTWPQWVNQCLFNAGTKPKLVAKSLATNSGHLLCMGTKISCQD